MRIAFLVHSFPEISETFIIRQVTGLLERGHDVRIFAHHAASAGPAHEVVGANDLMRRVRVLSRPSLSAPHSLAAIRLLHREHARSMGGWRALASTLALLSREEPFDVVHCHYGDIGLHYRAVARLWRAPLVVSFYGYDASSYPRAHGEHIFAPLFSVASAVNNLSAHMDARLQELGCPTGLLHRVPLAVDPDIRQHALHRPTHTGPARLLTVARLTEKKGIEYALRAIALVSAEFPGLRYDIIGDGPLRGELEHLTDALGIRASVNFMGARTDLHVRAALNGADIFVLPSVTAANGDQEGTPTAIVEAALCELPVLSTMHAGIPELVLDGESGYLVPERDHVALANAMRTLLRSPERWAAMGGAGRRHLERSHTTAAVAERLEQIYLELTGRVELAR